MHLKGLLPARNASAVTNDCRSRRCAMAHLLERCVCRASIASRVRGAATAAVLLQALKGTQHQTPQAADSRDARLPVLARPDRDCPCSVLSPCPLLPVRCRVRPPLRSVRQLAACARDAPYARVVRVAWAQRRWWAFVSSVVYGNVAVKASAVAENRSGGDALVLPACVSLSRMIGAAA